MTDRIVLRTCPRCGERGYETLKHQQYCALCDYAPEFDTAGFYIEYPDEALETCSEIKRELKQIEREAANAICDDCRNELSDSDREVGVR